MSLVDELRGLPARAIVPRLTQLLAREIAEFLQLGDAGAVGPRDGFVDLGFTSLLAVDFKVRLEELLGCRLRSTALFDQPTLEALVDFLAHDALGLLTRQPDESSEARPPPRRAPRDELQLPPREAWERLEASELRRLLAEAADRLEQQQLAAREPVAIVGMACRFPGEASRLEDFWRLQIEGVDAISEVPADRWNVDAYYDPDPGTPGKMATRHGGFVGAVDGFDARFFGISPREAVELDPVQRLLLECSWHALESAAVPPSRLHGTRAGVFIGCRPSEYWLEGYPGGEGDLARMGAYAASGSAMSTAAGRISYVLGLQGACLALDTACSSSLVAIHYACQVLRSGEIDAALAGGVNLMLAPHASIATSQARMLAADGRCKAFSAEADGYVRSEGCGVLFLKRLSDAVAAGDPIRAVIRGTAVNQDGASGGLTAPSGTAQAALIRAALADAGLRGADVDYVEAHGTGTALGDPIEAGALTETYGAGRAEDDPVLLGSIKTNIGHLEAAAGVAGVIRSVQALEHGVLPRLLHCEQPSRHIDWARSRLRPVGQLTPWPVRGERRRAAVSSFGFSGTNAHLILEEAPPRFAPEAVAKAESEAVVGAEAEPASTEVLLLSARDEEALVESLHRHAAHLEAREGGWPEVCATAALGRDHFKHRAFIVAEACAPAAHKLRQLAPAGLAAPVRGRPRTAMLFTGQGSQYPGMARELHAREPGFAASFDRARAALRAELGADLLDVMWGEKTGALDRTRWTQPCLFALEYGLAQLWLAWGLEPDALLGHSIGEYAAACIAGVFSLEDAARLVAARGRLMDELARTGSMLAVGASAELVRPLIEPLADRVSLAADNAPEQVVLSGDADAIAVLGRTLEERGLRVARLQVSHAFHSPLMQPMLGAFAEVAQRVTYRAPSLKMISTVSGRLAGAELAQPGYWVEQVGATVKWRQAALALQAGDPCELFLEIGPGGTLLALTRASLDVPGATWISSLGAKRADGEQLATAIGQAYVAGAPLRFEAIFGERARRRGAPELPGYPFSRKRYWLAAPAGGSRAAGQAREVHPLLGHPVWSAAFAPGQHVFEAVLGETGPAFLADHKVYEQTVVPGTAFVELALAAAAQLGHEPLAVELTLEQPLVLAGGGAIVQVVVEAPDARGRRIQIHGRALAAAAGEPAAWVRHIEGHLLASEGEPEAAAGGDLVALEARCAERIPAATLYARLRGLGLSYGPAFTGVRELAVGEGEVLARVELPAGGSPEGYLLHPALLDACLHSLLPLVDVAGAYVPAQIERLVVHRLGATRVRCRGALRPPELSGPPDARVRCADVQLFDEEGALVASISGLRLVPVGSSAVTRADELAARHLYRLRWRKAEAPAGHVAPGRGEAPWLVVGDLSLGGRLVEQLRQRGSAAAVGGPSLEQGEATATLLAAFRRQHEDCRGVLYVAGDPGELPAERAEAWCRELLQLVLGLEASPWERPPPLVLITRGAQPVSGEAGDAGDACDPAGAALVALLRAAAAEHPAWSCRSLDLPRQERAGELLALLDELLSDSGESEVAFRGQGRHVPRMARARASHGDAGVDGDSDALPIPEGAFELALAEYGSFEHLRLRPARRGAVAEHEVEVEVEAAALNFKDVLYVLGALTEYARSLGIETAEQLRLGHECAGVVTRVGSQVSGVAIGDRVIAATDGAMRSHVVVDRRRVFPAPPGLTAPEAASMLTVFSTAVHALRRLGELHPGQLVLLHAAAGGVGQAALQVARQAGATVLATASRGKWAHLRSQGIEHVMDSRSLDFADEVLAATGGRGVDLVLNSLTGEVIPASLRVIAAGGCFLDIGKIGAWSAAQVAALRPDVRYATFDLWDVLVADPALALELYQQIAAGFASGDFRPVPIQTFPISSAVRAFRALAQARNIGKIVLCLAPEAAPAAPGGEAAVVRRDRSYLVTGGLGALGLEVAHFLLERGAGQIALLGRQPPAAEVEARLQALREGGADILVLSGDVARREEVELALARLTLPLGGVVHAAGVLDDAPMSLLTGERMQRVLSPKVRGAWNLHEATAGRALDFFVLFSSMSAWRGQPGQSAYAAANAFLDGLAHARRAAGLPAVSIAWGPWQQAGMAARLSSSQRVRLERSGISSLGTEEGLAALGKLLTCPEPAIGAVRVEWDRFFEAQRVPLPTSFTTFAPAASGLRDDAAAIQRLAPGERRPAIHRVVAGRLAQVLGFADPADVDVSQRFTEMGIDSLMAVELRNQLGGKLGRVLRATILFDHPTPAALIDHLLAELGS